MHKVRRAGLTLLLLVVAAVAVVTGYLAHQGFRAYVIHTGSMSPSYRSGDVVLESPPAPLRVGQVITFLHSGRSTDVVTHRIIGLARGTIQTKGDGNPTADVWDIRPDQVRGTVVGSVPHLGYLMVYLKHPAGVASTMTGVLALVFLYGMFTPAQVRRRRHAAPRGRRAPRASTVAAQPSLTPDEEFLALRIAPAPREPQSLTSGRAAARPVAQRVPVGRP